MIILQIDHKKYEKDESNVPYLKLPATRTELADGQKPSMSGLSLSNKDCFHISTNVCSTKLTQNGNGNFVTCDLIELKCISCLVMFFR